MAAHLVWAIRKDGWMRRVEVGFPYPPHFRVMEPTNLFPATAPDEHPLERDALKTRLFEKRTLQKPPGMDWLPWEEPCYYFEV